MSSDLPSTSEDGVFAMKERVSRDDGRDKEREESHRQAGINPGGVGIRRDRTRFMTYEV